MIGGPPSRIGHFKPASCTGKTRFDSASLAHQVAKRAVASKRHRGKLKGGLRAYHCEFCGGYHIGGGTGR